MPPKTARRYTSIPAGIGSPGGKQERDVGRDATGNEDGRGDMPLIARKPSLVPRKRKPEAVPEKEPKQLAKALEKPSSLWWQEGGRS